MNSPFHDPTTHCTVVSYVLAALLGYLLGAVPIAYVIVRWKSSVDIRLAGSGNVGTLNSFQVTGSRLVGVLVLAGDVLKGFAAVLCARALWGNDFTPQAIAGVSVVLGHNFPVWLGFKGGRGLATAAGVMFAFGWLIVALWGACWALGYLALRSINPANALALVVTLLLIELAPDKVLSSLLTSSVPPADFRLFVPFMIVIMLVKHIEPVREYIQGRENASSLKEP